MAITDSEAIPGGFSSEWDERYQANEHLSIWPWSDLVSLVLTYARPSGKDFRVLELGCGAGANIPFFLDLGADYYAIEGSEVITKRLMKKYSQLKDRIIIADFTQQINISGKFDLIIDRSSLTHNTTSDIKKCIDMIVLKLKNEGKFIGVTWFSTAHTEFKNGELDADDYTRRSYAEGPFANVGKVHFSDKDHLLSLFNKFKVILMEHKIIRREIPPDEYINASWNFVMEKPH